MFTWINDFNPCFLEMQAPYLTSLEIRLQDDRTIIPWKVFEALPALVKLSIGIDTDTMRDATVLRSLTMALHHSALRYLESIEMTMFDFTDRVGEFMEALAGSDCAKCIMYLSFIDCGVGPEGMCALGCLLGKEKIPALEALHLLRNPGIRDVGVVALAEAMLKPMQTF